MAGRLEALIQLQKKINEYEVDFDMKRTLLENKFEAILKSAYDQRAKLISDVGECSNDSGNNTNNNAQVAWNSNKSNDNARNINGEGIQWFWYDAFMNSRYMDAITQETDRDALMYLMNVKAHTDISQLKYNREYSFRLEFHFAPNPYFHNHVLTKTYFVTIKPDKDNPFHYDGPRIYKSTGCEIKWKTGMDLTVLTSKKNHSPSSLSVLHSGLYYQGALKKWMDKRGSTTFFNFFNFPEIPENVVLDGEDASLLDNDFQLGWHIKDELIPQALFYFLGDISDNESDKDESEGASDESSEESEDSGDSEGHVSDQIVEQHIRNKRPLVARGDLKSKNKK